MNSVQMKKIEWLITFRTICVASLTLVVQGCLDEDIFNASLMTDSEVEAAIVETIIDGTGSYARADSAAPEHWLMMTADESGHEGEVTVTGYCWYDDSPSAGPPLEELYTWYAVNADRLCPAGWHLRPDEEFEVLGSLHEMTGSEEEIFWQNSYQQVPEEPRANLVFELPEGCHISIPSPEPGSVRGYQVSSSVNYDSHDARIHYLTFYEKGQEKKNGFRIYAFSVQCVKN
jgi:uncharacterized protein (TIGR02145 family)